MKSESSFNEKLTIDDLIRRSWNLRDKRDFNKFIDFIAKFEHYSRYNTMLVYIQNEEVTFFGGKSYWNKNFGRTVSELAKPYIILAPKSPIMLVYDVMETEGIDSPKEFLNKMFGEKLFEVKGKIDPKIYEVAVLTAQSWGIQVIKKPLNYFKGGYVTTAVTEKLEIYLQEGATVEENFTVLLHEIAHILLGHTGHKELRKAGTEKKLVLPEIRKIPRSTEELEAETVSYLISTKLGLIKRSEEYMAAYIKDINDLIHFSYETVVKVTDKIENMFLLPVNRSKNPIQGTLF